jgi:hypothetical protein
VNLAAARTRVADIARRMFGIVVLFCVLRLAVGLALILFDDGAVAWGWQATVIVAGGLAVYVLVALAVRAYAPPRR